MIINFDDFLNVDIRSGTIIKAEPFARAKKPAYKIWVDFGSELGTKQSSAQITVNYTPETLVGRQVCAVVNLGTKNIAGFESQFLVLGMEDEAGAICLVKPEPKVPNGRRLH